MHITPFLSKYDNLYNEIFLKYSYNNAEKRFPTLFYPSRSATIPFLADLFIYSLHKIGLFITFYQYNTGDEDM